MAQPTRGSLEYYEQILNAPASTPLMKDQAQKAIERLAVTGQIQVQQGIGGTPANPQVQAVINALQKAVNDYKGGSVDAAQVQALVEQELKRLKISFSDLDDNLKSMIQSTQKVELTIRQMGVVTSQSTSNASEVNRPLIQNLLSDLQAKNNSYLYGGAGTGKTYSAKIIKNLIGWELITLNCNQFTSPIDIIGGQTIDGYQEGKLSMAWSNEIISPDGQKRKVPGVVLLLDELPKIDPNTAGLLNEALAAIKDFDFDSQGNVIPPSILNGRNERLFLGNLFVMGTGNVPLNTIDPDYEANFKQDLSLQDRFIGSTYKVFVDYENEFNRIMKGFAFIWIYGTKLREKIVELNATGQAFVSIRLMQNLRETYIVYRETLMQNKKGVQSLISNPKTIIESLETFFSLFKPATRDALMSDPETSLKQFVKIVEQKNKMKFDPTDINFDTPDEITQGQSMIQAYNRRKTQI